MGGTCHARSTNRRRAVTAAGWLLPLFALALAGLGGAAARAEGEPLSAQDAAALLRRAARADAPLAERLVWVEQVLERTGPEGLPPGPAVRAGAQLLAEAPKSAGWLIHRGLESGHLDLEVRTAALARVGALLADAAPASATRALLAAIGFRLGERPEAALNDLTAAWPPSALTLALLRADLGTVPFADGTLLSETSDAGAVRALLEESLPVLRLLDQAERDDLVVSRAGLDGLVKLGGAAVPVLLHEARLAAKAPTVGRRERGTRAVLVLGQLGDRRATSALIAALSSEDGWVRVYAATALGDLGDPAAVVALARQCTLLGDPLRQQDQWEYPGSDNTPIAESDWASAPYYVIDTTAADALLRLGVRGAAGWLITNQLDPRKKSYRVRVLQDATDALARSAKGCPVAAYNVDEGLPQRERAWRGLVAWWYQHRHEQDLLVRSLDERDPRYRAAAATLADVFAGPSVREMMMAKAAIQLLGPDMTLALIASIPNARNAFHRAELAESLGLVDDPRAVPGLMQLVRDKQVFVRKKAVKSLGAYVEAAPEALELLQVFLSSKRAGLRVAAMEGLVNAPPSEAVRKAVEAWVAEDAKRVEADKPSWLTPDIRIALTVVRLVQEGAAHLPAVMQGLAHEQRAKRRIWWDLVRAALKLPEPLHDPVSDPKTPWARRIDAAALAEAVRRRRDG